jgi:uncharacterized protein
MKNAKLFHGTGCSPESYWFPYVKKNLQKLGYTVDVPQLPETDNPDLSKWLPVALNTSIYDSETIIVGHSAGGPLVLSVLENINVQISIAILIAGYARPKGKLKLKEKILQDQYDWEKIKHTVKELYFVNSDNDPWGCNDVEGRYMLDHLGGTLIIKQGEGHMGSDSYHQPYKEFPLLVKLLS